jgi:outer membrane protein assembly factor BamA
MKKFFITLCVVLLATCLAAQDNGKTLNENGEIIKKGWNFGPLPVVGYNSDLGFQYGACVDIFNYGDGSNYPGYDFKINFEVSTYTKGSSIFRSYSYWNNIIPKGVLFADFGYFIDKKFDFYGFNGYASPYYKDLAVNIDREANYYDFSPGIVSEPGMKESGLYYRDRRQFRAVLSMRQKIGNLEHLSYGVGLAFYDYKFKPMTIKKYEDQYSLYSLYCQSGLIREDEQGGGHVTQFKAGIIYDSKNYENDPTRGIYFEATFTAAPDFIDRHGYDHLTFTGVFHHYIPVWGDHLTFSYRIGAQNVIAGDIPFYAMMNTNLMFYKKIYTEAYGGSTTGRGINRNSVIGQGVAWLNAELRWRITNFKFINQNWCVAINPMFDAGMVTQTFRLEEQKAAMKQLNHITYDTEKEYDLIYSGKEGSLHTSAGCGLKLIMNKNFVVSAEFAKALNKLDGEGMRAYIGFNYIF